MNDDEAGLAWRAFNLNWFPIAAMGSLLLITVGTYCGLGLSPGLTFPHLDSTMYVAQLRDIRALRDGSLRHLELFKLAGIVSFPSFHTASAVLYGRCGRSGAPAGSRSA